MFDYLNDLARTETGSIGLQWTLFANGTPDVHNNILLFGFPPGQTDPTHVAKICRSPAYSQTIRTEYERLRDLWQKLGAQAEGFAPSPLALGQHGTDLVLLMSYCPGDQLLPKPPRFWQNPAQVQALWQQAALCLRKLHRHTAVANPNFPLDSDFSAKADTFQTLFSLSPKETEALTALQRTITQAQTQAKTAVLLQGDFWPGNVILHPHHDQFTLVDWQFSRWSLDASPDVYLFILACSLKAAPYGPPAQYAADAARILADWQTAALPQYLKTYGGGGCTLLPPRPGMLACCVEMATRPTLTFGIQQKDGLLWRTLFTKLNDYL